jgi:hypothetical protein
MEITFMKYIELSQGMRVMVDNEDYKELNKYNWYAVKGLNTFYARRSLPTATGGKGSVRMHRIIMQTPEDMDTDHIDGNGLNNQKENLRLCTRSENLMNQRRNRNNTSGYKGVNWNKRDKKWMSQIKVEGKQIHLGYFSGKEEAYKAYCEASKKYHGEFGNVY